MSSQDGIARVRLWKIKHGDADLHGLGDPTMLRHRWLALIWSIQCPGSVVIKTFDAIRELRDADAADQNRIQNRIETCDSPAAMPGAD